MPVPELDVLTGFVSRIFRVEDVTAGEPKEWIVRYRGRLITDDTVAAYDQLAESVRPYNITPLFRKEPGDKQVIFLVQSPIIPRFGSRIYINIILFIITLFSIMLMGVDIPPGVVADGSGTIPYLFLHIFSGWPFALSMMGILFAHEMGHYVMCRY